MSQSGLLKLRETLWFKKGELDAEEAQRAAAGNDDLAPGAADLLPVGDRYRDDGTLTRTDTHAFGLHTGTTQWLRPVDEKAHGVGEAELVREMKRSARLYTALLLVGLAGLAAAVFMVVIR